MSALCSPRCGPCSTPCLSPCYAGPTGPTGPAPAFSPSWVQAVINASKGAIPVPTDASYILGYLPWLVQGGNADHAFHSTSGQYFAPADGVYEATFAIVFSTGADLLGSVSIGLLVNGSTVIVQTELDTIVAAANKSILVNGIFSLKKGDALQPGIYANVAGFILTTAVSPAASPSFFSVKRVY